MRIYTRGEVGLRPPKAAAYYVAATGRVGYFNHYDGDAPIKSVTMAEATAHWLRVQRQHMDSNGWNDIGYNYGISMGGHILEGRGLTAVGAHCPDWNLNSWGVQFMHGTGQPLTDLAKAAACDLYGYLMVQAEHALLKKGHRDGFATACPGVVDYVWVKAGMPRPTSVPAPTPTPRPSPRPVVVKPVRRPAPAPWRPFPLSPGYYFGLATGPKVSVSGKFSHRVDVVHLQTQLAARGWKITVDGVVGEKTVRCFRQFQSDQGLLVDGHFGRLSWKAAYENPLR
ncbi:MAG: N-acetylmuramoyl-L-alanine amidase [Rhodoglobus sp.]